ncbi:MAG TPA: hypothetical protein VFF73_01855, partial [Planctomycetota bacterium]|nr:hypothetical protein [Planctomycetota bacterium]
LGGSSSGGSGLGSILGSLLGGGSSTGGAGGGLGSILGSLLGGGSGGSGGFGSILSSLLGALTGGSGSSGGIGSLLSGLLGGSGGGLGSLLGGLFGGSSASVTVSPNAGGITTPVTQMVVTASGLGTITSVQVGSVACTNIVATSTGCTCTLGTNGYAPAGTAPGAVTVTVYDNTGATATASFTFQ